MMIAVLARAEEYNGEGRIVADKIKNRSILEWIQLTEC
jgi:hypothetical protein